MCALFMDCYGKMARLKMCLSCLEKIKTLSACEESYIVRVIRLIVADVRSKQGSGAFDGASRYSVAC